MSKPKHPSASSIKAGQTIYIVCYDWGNSVGEHYVHAITITAKSAEAPLEGSIIDLAPVNWLRINMNKPAYANDPYVPMKPYFFYSKRKALSFAKQLNRGAN